MQKQTVSERYQVTQNMNKTVKPNQQAALQNMSNEEQLAIQLCNQLQQTLLTAQQSVQQMYVEHPESQTVHTAHQRLTSASQLLHQLKSTIPKTAFPLAKSTEQQLTQLEYQINKANGTLQLIQQSFEKSILP